MKDDLKCKAHCEIQCENQGPAQSAFCCCNSFWAFWRPKTDQNSFGKMCKTHFTGLLAAVPCIRVLQTTAGVMPEHWRSPNLALNANSESSFSSFLHITTREFQYFFARAFFVVLFAAPPTKCTTNFFGNTCNPHFANPLAVVLCFRVIRTIASVMPELTGLVIISICLPKNLRFDFWLDETTYVCFKQTNYGAAQAVVHSGS